MRLRREDCGFVICVTGHARYVKSAKGSSGSGVTSLVSSSGTGRKVCEAFFRMDLAGYSRCLGSGTVPLGLLEMRKYWFC